MRNISRHQVIIFIIQISCKYLLTYLKIPKNYKYNVSNYVCNNRLFEEHIKTEFCLRPVLYKISSIFSDADL